MVRLVTLAPRAIVCAVSCLVFLVCSAGCSRADTNSKSTTAEALDRTQPELSPGCRLTPGLYAQRAALVERELTEFERMRRTDTTTFAQKKAIDRGYFDFLYAIAVAHSKGDFATADSCCDAVRSDPVAVRMCALVRHSAGRLDQEALIASFPKDEAEVRDYWILGEIWGAGGDNASVPGISGDLQDQYRDSGTSRRACVEPAIRATRIARSF